jgi:hypothetical protein
VLFLAESGDSPAPSATCTQFQLEKVSGATQRQHCPQPATDAAAAD